MMGGSLQQAHLYELESYDLAMAVVSSVEFKSIELTTVEVNPDSTKSKWSVGTFKHKRTPSRSRSTPRMRARWSGSGLV
jgi:DNA integrity scanning protein DisA with diadenylate cyclase activity